MLVHDMLWVLATKYMSPADYLCWAEAWLPLQRVPCALRPTSRAHWVHTLYAHGTRKQIHALWLEHARGRTWQAADQWTGFLLRADLPPMAANNTCMWVRDMHIACPLRQKHLAVVLEALYRHQLPDGLVYLKTMGALSYYDIAQDYGTLRWAFKLVWLAHVTNNKHYATLYADFNYHALKRMNIWPWETLEFARVYGDLETARVVLPLRYVIPDTELWRILDEALLEKQNSYLSA